MCPSASVVGERLDTTDIKGGTVSATYGFLRFDVEDAVAYMTFDDPESANRYSRDQEWELFDALSQIRRRKDIHAVVVTGEGDHFGGGANRRDDTVNVAQYYERALRLFDEWSRLDTPVVVALNGPGQLTLPLLSDIVIAERHVRICDRHVLSDIATATGSFLWPMSTGLAKAKRYLLVGDTLSADEAQRIGLISEVVDTGSSKSRACEIATTLARLEPTGVQMTKRALNEWVRASWGPIFKHAMGLEFVHFPDSYERNRRQADLDREHGVLA